MAPAVTLFVVGGWRARHRGQPYLWPWLAALLRLIAGLACQLAAERMAGSPAQARFVHRLGYLSGTMLPAVYLGQGVLEMAARRRIAHIQESETRVGKMCSHGE